MPEVLGRTAMTATTLTKLSPIRKGNIIKLNWCVPLSAKVSSKLVKQKPLQQEKSVTFRILSLPAAPNDANHLGAVCTR